MPTTRDIGFAAEQEACEFLKAHGLMFIAQNYQCKMGEIDLIMKDKDALVFVEVRKRSQADFGSGAETITRHKQRCIIKTALFYLLETQQYDACPMRIDVIDICLRENNNHVEWLKNAILEKW